MGFSLVLVALVAATVGAPKALIVGCGDVIGQARTGTDGGYRVVLGVVSVPPARLRQVVATREGPWRSWRKAGLVVRAGNDAVDVRVPRAWRRRVAITWGNGGGPVSALRIAPCPSPRGVWNAYAGGFLLRERADCVPLTFTVAGRSRTVRFGVGRRC
jgi:hypothetical protein